MLASASAHYAAARAHYAAASAHYAAASAYYAATSTHYVGAAAMSHTTSAGVTSCLLANLEPSGCFIRGEI